MMKKVTLCLVMALYFISIIWAQDKPYKTYCNPINIDYGYTPIPNFATWGKHRATADPVIVTYKGDYYLFSTNQRGYWWSKDMSQWNFVERTFLLPQHKVYDDLCAPAVWIQGDTLLVFGSTYSSSFPIWMSTNPKANEWSKAIDSLAIGGWDPAFFVDTDKKLYMYNGSSNRFPMYGIEINRKNFTPKGTRKETYSLEPWKYGWQRFGDYVDNTFLDPFIEGSWMTKHNGKYYLQYGAPGTEFSNYSDGVVVGTGPLGPFFTQSDPLSSKLGGFARGAGHGATFQDENKNYWHVSTMVISVKNNFERRIGIWPAGFDKNDKMWCNTAFGDYPHYLPKIWKTTENADYNHSYFTGWMLLNYQKPIQVSSTLGGFSPNFVADENIKTYWSAKTGNKDEWVQSDFGEVSTLHAIQINYADQDAEFLGKKTNIGIKYQLFSSLDEKKWTLLIDKSNNKTDVPHDYIELQKPIQARYIRLINVHVPSGKFAISGLRAFGLGKGQKPKPVEDFMVLRTEKDKRSAWIRWKPSVDAYAYNIYYGTNPHQMYNCIMVHNENQYWFKGMDKDQKYYFCIEAINENGIATKSNTIEVN